MQRDDRRPYGIDGPELLDWMITQADETPRGCLEWQRSRSTKGYGQIGYRGRLWAAHRLVLHLLDRLPDGLHALHRCDNPCCINPDHLFAGTNADNQQDKFAKGRGVVPDNRGERHGNAKIKDVDVVLIRERYESGGVFQRELAEQFGVSRAYISEIVGRKSRTAQPQL